MTIQEMLSEIELLQKTLAKQGIGTIERMEKTHALIALQSLIIHKFIKQSERIVKKAA